MNTSPIGFVDSGSGGLTVMQACRRLLPYENFVYVSDSSGRWGSLSSECIAARVDECVRLLCSYRCKAVVLACNTATAVAADELRRLYDFPIVGSEPALRPARLAYPDGTLLLLCTPATARQPRIAALARDFAPVTVRALPGFADRIERSLASPQDLGGEVREILDAQSYAAVVLGCTHYVHLRALFAEAAGETPSAQKVFDGCDGVARRLRAVLRERNALCGARTGQEFYDAV